MRQLIDRFAPWAPLALFLGIVASLVEAAEERDVSSAVLLLISLAAALVLVRVKRGLTRGEVRAEIAAGVRALVKEEALVGGTRMMKRMVGRQLQEVPVPSVDPFKPQNLDPRRTLTEAPTDPTWDQIKEDHP